MSPSLERGSCLSLILSLEEAKVVSQGREPLGTERVPRTKSPEGAAETSTALPPLRGLAICRIPVQGLAPLANNCRPVPGLGSTRLGTEGRWEIIPSLILMRQWPSALARERAQRRSTSLRGKPAATCSSRRRFGHGQDLIDLYAT